MPWELLDRSVAWIEIAVMAMDAEDHAEAQRSKRRHRRL